MKLSKKQKQIFHSLEKYRETKNIFVFDGSIRTGKTKFATWAFIHRTITNANLAHSRCLFGTELEHFNSYALVAWTYGNVERTIEPYIREYLAFWDIDLQPHGKHGTKFEINGTTIFLYYAGADNKKSINKVQGQTLHGCFFDESALLDMGMIEGTIGRMITFEDAFVVFCTNPEGGEEHPFYKRYIKPQDENVLRVATEMKDNPTISKKTIESLAKKFSDTMYKRKVLGLWVVSEGAVYPVMPKIVPIEELPKLKYINIGVDEGRSDRFTGYSIGYGEDGRYHVFREYCEDALSYVENVSNIKQFATDLANEFNLSIDIIGETNPGILVDTLKNDITLHELINVQYVSKAVKNMDWQGKGSIQERIDIVNFMIASDLIRVYDTCPELISALENAVYNDKGVRLDDGSTNIDSLDGMEYGLSTELKDIWEDVLDELEKGAN